ncbi:unnamed protein product [Clonostachys byssicola]|uniref:FAD-binding PCMH-type domain-containing protein n=1 Tax=Clonostachys byssicola TaxID=160290 RepID=A0A9N9UBY1_9HYPO|nr:unnamed protein product [Clonostachys byssicola]
MGAKSSFLTAAAAMTGLASASEVPWDTLNSTVSGRLQPAIPIEKACFTSYNGHPNTVDTETCDFIRANYTSNSLRIDNPQVYMQLTNQICVSDPSDQCVLDAKSLPATMPSSNSTCRTGNVPSYFLEVKTAADVSAAFNFAKENQGVEISVKNSGHDFMTRSSGKGTLNLWTHKLQGMTYHDNFKPQGCEKSVGAAMTVMAGVSTGDAYNFADAHNALIMGPYAPSVPISAGWVTGGGHNVFAPVFGLGADRVVEFSIVTPDGVERVANEQQNSDLFWALRGGGGGAFGVILSATHRVEPRTPIAYADIHLPSNISTDQALDWVKLLAEDSLAWGYAGWGGHVGGTFVTHFNPLPALTNDNGTAARAAFQRATDFAIALGGTSHVAVEESFSTIFNRDMVPKDTKMGGNFHFTTTRLMPTSMFESAEGIETLIQYMHEAIDMGFDPRSFYTPVTTPFVYKANDTKNAEPKDYGTSMTQAWYKALWHVESSKAIPVGSTYQERLTALTNLTTLTVKLENIMGADGGSYMNEADPYTPDWKESFYGLDNYEKLLKIKNKYDPQSLLKCWKCVGFDEEKDSDLERFACNKKIQADIIKGLKA